VSKFLYGVVVTEPDGPHLVARIARSRSGIYYLMPRDPAPLGSAYTDFDPHTSYHSDGTFHTKEFGKLVFSETKKQPLNASFAGAEHLFAETFGPGSLRGLPLIDLSKFSGICEIPFDELGADDYHLLAVDIVEPNRGRIPVQLGAEIVLEQAFREASPWIHLTFWRGEISFAVR
jgi:hypothetical protein